jgi:hypothetical protein
MAHLVDIMVLLDFSLRLWLLLLPLLLFSNDDDEVLMMLLWIVDAVD